MTEILSAEEVVSERYRYPDSTTEDGANDVIALCESHEALRARLAEVEAEREAARSNVAHWSAEWSTRLRAAEARLAEVEAERDEAVRELDADDYEDQVCARVAAERRLAEVEQALRDVIAWVGQIGYPYDFTTIPPLPDQFVRPLAEWWWHDSGEDGTVDEWEDGIADEAQIAGRAVLDKGEQHG